MRRSNLKRQPKSSKADYGHVLLVAGSQRMSGAAYLCALAAARCGAGKVTLATPKSVQPLVARRLAEVMTLPLPDLRGALHVKALSEICSFARKASVVVIGPGLGLAPSTQQLVRQLIPKLNCPVVLDADGLNSLRGCASLVRRARDQIVLTPHEGEFVRLTHLSKKWVQKNRKKVAKQFSSDYDCSLVLKGKSTVVTEAGGRTYENQSGNPGLASGGTGDVLAGMIGAFIATGFEPFFAAALAVYVHGRAGDRAAKKTGQTALLASDVIAALPIELRHLERASNLRHKIRLA